MRRSLFEDLNKKFVIIDGDDIRELYKNTDYSIEGRKFHSLHSSS